MLKDLSEFKAKGFLEIYLKDGVPAGSVEGAKACFVKNGEAIPKVFIPTFLRSNRNFIENLKYENGIPVLTVEQEKEYGVSFSFIEKKPMKVTKDKYNQESLNVKLVDLGVAKFKDYAEEVCGVDVIDKRKSAKAIITQMLEIQEAGRR